MIDPRPSDDGVFWDRSQVEAALAAYLPGQRWFASSAAPEQLLVRHCWVERTAWPRMARVVVEADGGCYQLVLGIRPIGDRPEFLSSHNVAVVGELDGEEGRIVAYDAIYDPVLALELLKQLLPDATAERSRVMGVEQSNSSVVYDERIIVKIFRRLHDGPNPEVEMTRALVRTGFTWVAEPLAGLTREGYDLAVAQPFLGGAVEGWALALTSLRDLFGVHDTRPVPVIDPDGPPPTPDPGQAGGDFSAEARRLGETTAAMHVGLAEAFGRQPGDAGAWADDIGGQFSRAELPVEIDRSAGAGLFDALRAADAGPAIRVHGDYHLGQVLRTDAGWYVLDFEGEPARPLDERRRPTSALRDVAGMLRSFHYASAVATLERDAQAQEVGLAWESRNRKAFLEGYIPLASRGGVLPPDAASVTAVLAAFEMEKAVYELVYERAYRPHWEQIPLAAVRRLVHR